MSHSQRIVGLTKKGKEFFKLTSSLTETIQNMAVEDTRIWTGCECIYSLYNDGKDAALFACKDEINDLITAHLTRSNDFDTILACQDSCIRVIHESVLFLEIPTPSAVTAVALLELEGARDSVKSLVFGLSSGALGLAKVSSTGVFNIAWLLEDGKQRSPVTCLKIFDLNKDGVPEIIVGRDDGRIEVFRPTPDQPLAPPTRIFSKDIGATLLLLTVHAL